MATPAQDRGRLVAAPVPVGSPWLGCLSGPMSVWALGHRSSHQPCTLPHMFPPQGTFYFLKFLDIGLISALQTVLCLFSPKDYGTRAGFPNTFSSLPSPSTCTSLTSSQWLGFKHFFSTSRKSTVLIVVLEPKCLGSVPTPFLTVPGVTSATT